MPQNDPKSPQDSPIFTQQNGLEIQCSPASMHNGCAARRRRRRCICTLHTRRIRTHNWAMKVRRLGWAGVPPPKRLECLPLPPPHHHQRTLPTPFSTLAPYTHPGLQSCAMLAPLSAMKRNRSIASLCCVSTLVLVGEALQGNENGQNKYRQNMAKIAFLPVLWQ